MLHNKLLQYVCTVFSQHSLLVVPKCWSVSDINWLKQSHSDVLMLYKCFLPKCFLHITSTIFKLSKKICNQRIPQLEMHLDITHIGAAIKAAFVFDGTIGFYM